MITPGTGFNGAQKRSRSEKRRALVAAFTSWPALHVAEVRTIARNHLLLLFIALVQRSCGTKPGGLLCLHTVALSYP